MKAALIFVAGVAAGISVIVACGNDSPGDADADPPVCDCPAAEPPVAGRVILRQVPVTIRSSLSAQIAACQEGEVFLGGGCYFDTRGLPGVTVQLVNAGVPPEGNQWSCWWHNPMSEEFEGHAQALCLAPPP